MAQNQMQNGGFSPSDKVDYYGKKAQTTTDPILKDLYEAKHAYWEKVAGGIPVSPEEQAKYGPGHAKLPAELYDNACLWLSRSKDEKKIEEFTFKKDYWAKVVRHEPISQEDQVRMEGYRDVTDRNSALAEISGGRSDRYHAKSVGYRNSNALALAESILSGDFPAFCKGRQSVDGKISFNPVSVRNFADGHPYFGITQLVGQAMAVRNGWGPSEDGHIYLLTGNRAGVVRDNSGKQIMNVKRGAKHMYIASVGNEKDFDEQLKKSGSNAKFASLSEEEQKKFYFKSEKFYKVYNSKDLVDASIVPRKEDPAYWPKSWNCKSVVFDASNVKTPAEMLGTYMLCCQYGGKYVITPEKAAEMLKAVKNEISKDYSDGNGFRIAKWADGVTRTAYKERGRIFDELKKRDPNLAITLAQEAAEEENKLPKLDGNSVEF